MATLTHSFEGGSNADGQTVTQSTSGASATLAGVTSTYVLDSDFAAHGTLSAYAAPTATTTRIWWTGSAQRVLIRGYLRVAGLPTSDWFLLWAQSAGTVVGRALLNSTGKARVSTTGSVARATAPSNFPTLDFTRVELLVDAGTSTADGSVRLAYYDGDDTTPIWDSGLVTGINTSGGAALDSFYFGQANTTNAHWWDDLGVRTDGDAVWGAWPAGNTVPTVDAGVNQNVAAAATVNLASTAADSDGTIASRAWTFDYPTSGAPSLTGGSTANASFTAGAAGSLYVLRHTVTDNDGASAFDTVEIRVPSTGDLRPLPGDGTVVGTWTALGAAATRGAALADESDTTAVVSPLASGTEASVRVRLAPSTTRTAANVVLRIDQDVAGTVVATARLYEGASLRQSWTVTTSTAIANQTLALSSGTLSAIGDWGNLFLELAVSA